MSTWLAGVISESVERCLSLVAVGDEIRDDDLLKQLARGVEGLIGAEIETQYPPWPDGLATDGAAIDLCVRTADRTIDAYGIAWFDYFKDYGNTVFPVRGEFTGHGDRDPTATVYLGQVDARSGLPPRLRPGALVVGARPTEDDPLVPELVAKQLSGPIEWTPVVSWPSPG